MLVRSARLVFHHLFTLDDLQDRLIDMLAPAKAIHAALLRLEQDASAQPLVHAFVETARRRFKGIDMFCEPGRDEELESSRALREQCTLALPDELRAWPAFFDSQLPQADLAKVVETRRADSWSRKVLARWRLPPPVRQAQTDDCAHHRRCWSMCVKAFLCMVAQGHMWFHQNRPLYSWRRPKAVVAQCPPLVWLWWMTPRSRRLWTMWSL